MTVKPYPIGCKKWRYARALKRSVDVSIMLNGRESSVMTSSDTTDGVLSFTIGEQRLEFRRVTLVFLEHGIVNVFAKKNNKTVRETLMHKRYAPLAKLIAQHDTEVLDVPLGVYVLNLKKVENSTYKCFLNPYGDGTYCRFRMECDPLAVKKGLYYYCSDDRVVYVGRSYDPFEKRINQGYGTIHPKNCYLDGQATNCHLNTLIAEKYSTVALYVCPLDDDMEINRLERFLIRALQPPWNIALKQ